MELLENRKIGATLAFKTKILLFPLREPQTTCKCRIKKYQPILLGTRGLAHISQINCCAFLALCHRQLRGHFHFLFFHTMLKSAAERIVHICFRTLLDRYCKKTQD